MSLQPLDKGAIFNPRARRIKVALVDDDATFGRFVSLHLQAEGAIDAVAMTDGDELLAYPDIDELQCIILDFQMEGESGLQLAERLRNTLPKLPPFIMLTGTGDERRVIKALRWGFADYVPKRNLNFKHLEERIVTAVEQHAERERKEYELQRKMAQDAKLSVFDELTGCYARAYTMDRIAKLFSHGEDRAFALLLIEYESLDMISSSFGLAAAQTARKTFARKLRDSVRAEDIVGCFDESRFLCIMDTGCSAPAFQNLCNTITQRLSSSFNLGGTVIRLTGRAGGILMPEAEVFVQNFVSVLEGRLQKAKESGNLYHCGDSFEHSASDMSAQEAPGIPAVGEDRRRHRRRRVLRAAKIFAHDSTVTLDCSVRNISESGALLRFDGYFRPPSSFMLQIVGEGSPRPAEIRWQTGNDVGVEYVD